MKKHLLLFVMMALLPFTAWADELTVEFRVSTIEYQGDAITPPIKSVKDGDNSVTGYSLAYAKKDPDSDTYTSVDEIYEVGTYKVTVTKDDKSGTAILTVNKATLTATATNITKIYGEADPNPNFSVSGYKGYDSQYNVTISGLKVNRTDKSENVGTYTYSIDNTEASVSGGNYKVEVTGSASLIINKRNLSNVTIADIDDIVYDGVAHQPTPAVTDNGIASVASQTIQASDFTYSWSANTTDVQGTPTVTIIATLSGNYTGSQSKEFNITPRDITDNADIAIADITGLTYNGSNQEPTITVTDNGLATGTPATLGLISNYTAEYSSNKDAGENTASVTISGTGNYTGTKTQTFSIGKAELTVTAKPKTITYGEAPANDGVTYGAFQASETSDVLGGTLTYEYDYEQYGDVGNNYKITPDGLTSNNYEITFEPGTLTVEQKEVTLGWGTSTFAYDGTSKVPEATVTNNENSDEIGVTVEGAQTNAGDYTATASELTGDKAGNYKLPVTATQDFSIAKAELTITANPKTIIYGDVPANDGVTYGDFQNGDDENVLGGTLDYDYTYVQYGNVGESYTITPKGLNSDNYEIQFVAGTLTVEQKEVSLTWGDETTFTYDGTSKVPTVTVGSTVNNDEITATVTGVQINAGNNYTAEVTALTGDKAGNYKLPEATTQDFTINKANLTVTVLPQTITYGKNDTELATTVTKGTTVSYTALNNDENIDDELGSIGYKNDEVVTSIKTHEGVLVIEEGEITNYNIQCIAGNLTINPDAAVSTLALTDDATAFQKIKDYAGQTLPVTIKFANRNSQQIGTLGTWKAYYWHTLVLPFDISVADLSKALGYAIVNVIDDSKTVVSGTNSEFYGKLTMKGGNGYHAGEADEDAKLAANKPILLKLAYDIDVTKDYEFGTQTIVAPADLSVDAGGNASFVGTYTDKVVDGEDGANTWFMVGNYAKWAFINPGATISWTIKPFSAYIDMGHSSAREMIFYFEDIDGSVTAVKSVDANNLNSKQSAEGWYDLNGMKLNAAPTKKGIYIQNGKKVVIK